MLPEKLYLFLHIESDKRFKSLLLQLPDHKCSSTHKPRNQETCNTISCPMWETNKWSEVSTRQSQVPELRPSRANIPWTCKTSRRSDTGADRPKSFAWWWNLGLDEMPRGKQYLLPPSVTVFRPTGGCTTAVFITNVKMTPLPENGF